ncbi:MAG: calcium/proton exchanger [Chloroflexi bacterium]|nr:calcium/proton exchanger [Chloroflexota bacterium]
MKYLYPLLLFIPVVIAAQILHGSETLIFVAAALSIIPLAGLLGKATESLAHHTGPRIGGLLNATLGNAAELIITIVALRAGLVDVVKASITGSIIGNLLLVLGASLLAGGLKNGAQHFSSRTASTNASMMTLAIIGLAVPAVFGPAVHEHRELSLIELNVAVAAALMIGYVLSLIFSLTAPEEARAGTAEPGDELVESGPAWPLRLALVLLAASVAAMAYLSEALVGSLEPLLETSGLSPVFVGVIVIPIIGNIAEHTVAVQVALKNQMELSLGVSMGSSMQIALFVAPLLVFISLLFGKPMLLTFSGLELAALGMGVVIASLISLDGESNWLEGALLLLVYAILAFGFFFV